MKELQTFVAFGAYEQLFQQESMGVADQHAFMEKMYHGDGSPDTLSLCQQAVEGRSMFKGLYDENVPIVTEVSTQSRELELVLKPVLHCEKNKHIVVDKDGICIQMLSSNTLTKGD